MEKLIFSTNWNNKLECNFYTTIRIYNPRKHFVNNQFDIYLQRKYRGKAVVIGVVKTYLHKLNDYVCYLDTGYNKLETIELMKKIYKTKNIDFSKKQITILILQKIDPLKPVQQALFN
jgi:hypothetical protein